MFRQRRGGDGEETMHWGWVWNTVNSGVLILLTTFGWIMVERITVLEQQIKQLQSMQPPPPPAPLQK